jgi:hypothetical protein
MDNPDPNFFYAESAVHSRSNPLDATTSRRVQAQQFLHLTEALRLLQRANVLHLNLTPACIRVFPEDECRPRVGGFDMSDVAAWIPRFEPRIRSRPPELHLVTYAATLQRRHIAAADIAFVVEETEVQDASFLWAQLEGKTVQAAWRHLCGTCGPTWDNYALCHLFQHAFPAAAAIGLQDLPCNRRLVTPTDLLLLG